MFFHLRWLRSLRRQLGRDVMARLVSALVLSRLDYCNAVLTGLPVSTLAPLQRVLHAAARVVMDLRCVFRPAEDRVQAVPARPQVTHWSFTSIHK